MWKVFYNEGPEAKKQKKKFSQADIDEKVKLAADKKAAEDAKKTAEEKNELLQQAVNASVTACRNDFATNLVPPILNWTGKIQTRRYMISRCPISSGVTP